MITGESNSINILPKIDLHRHLEGSLRMSTLEELAAEGSIDLPADKETLRSLGTLVSADPRTPQSLLRKFQALRCVYASPELIQRYVREAIADAAADSIIHLEMRFSPMALAGERHFAAGDVIKWVLEAADKAAVQESIGVKLIASVNRHEPVETAEKIAQVVVDSMSERLVGFDLAGDEESVNADAFVPLFRDVQSSGMKITVHAGEWSGADAVRQALEVFQADRIGHGVRIVESEETVALARDRAVPFEVCPFSNIASGVTDRWQDHPIREMVMAGLLVTINTDNPGILDNTLSDEITRLTAETDISLGTIKSFMLNAANASFLLPSGKKALEEKLLSAYQLGL
ncbi:MAG: adenosine deaminase [Anaerolineales bacterium]|nr:adenosine deaminase [Anaerolineales bacterium]